MSDADSRPEPAAGTERPVALVTGSLRRIGRAIALRLAGAGWDLALHHRGRDAATLAAADALRAELRERGARAEAFAADLGDEETVRSLVGDVVHRVGRIDAVINNASMFDHDDAGSFGAQAALAHYRVNTVAPVLLAQGLHQQLRARDARGCVVNLLDQKLWNPNPDHLSYTLSKAALREAGTLLAQALAPHVRVVGVAPGMTLGSPLIDDARLLELQAAGPLGEGPRLDDVVDAVLFALRNRALTGCELLVDAGQHLCARDRDFAFD